MSNADLTMSDTPVVTPTLLRWSQWQDLSEWLEPLLLTPGNSTAFVADINRCAHTLIELVEQDPDLAIFHIVHACPEKMARYGILHSMHTGMLLTLVGKRKDWVRPRIDSAVKAALTMNLSITALQITLAQQVAPPTSEQRQAIAAHPLATWHMLRQLGVTDEDWLIAVAQHHEQPDGKGYPQGLTEINQTADALRTCDVFGAKLSPRVSRSGMLSTRAAAEIFRQRSAGYFGATIIRELGLYPPGCLVELNTGEQGIVVRRTRDPMSPEIVVLTNELGERRDTPIKTLTGKAHGRMVIGAAENDAVGSFFNPAAVLSLI
ncbi:MAG TPA: HD domain-containing phosphohydrolase [Aquabacterium sp.]|nr:HD domain-containing phosphohydrolase [Aquabacterium sp.]